MAFDLRPTKDVLPWPGNANMAFDLRPTEDVLPWPGNANMAFDLRPTEDVLPWPGNAKYGIHLRPTEEYFVGEVIEYGIYLRRRKSYFRGQDMRIWHSTYGPSETDFVAGISAAGILPLLRLNSSPSAKGLIRSLMGEQRGCSPTPPCLGTATAVSVAGAIGIGVGVWYFRKARAKAPVTHGVQSNENRLF
ncbi:hypothetical protein Tco_0944733 [Tanacetum coccineum]